MRKPGHPSDWKERVFNTHHAAQGFLNRVSKRHVAVIETHGASQWRVAYLPKGTGMPLNSSCTSPHDDYVDGVKEKTP